MVLAITATAITHAKASAASWHRSAVAMRNVPSAATWTAKGALMTNDDDDLDVWAAFAASEPMPVRLLYPNTVEEMLQALAELRQKHHTLDKIPYKDSLVPTHKFFEDLCNRLVALEKGDRHEP